MSANSNWLRFLLGAWILTTVAGVTQATELRTWSDQTGKFKIEAEFVESKGDTVVLLRQDGKRIEVPLNRLSDDDQAVVKTLITASSDNPFKVTDAPAASPLRPGEVAEPSWEGAIEVSLAAGDRWEISPGGVPELGFTPKIVGLPKKIDFFEGSSGFALSVPAKKAAISYLLKARGGRNAKTTSRIVVVDLESGRTLANGSLDGSFSVIAMHDDGKQIIAEKTESSGNFGRDKKHTLATLIADGTKVSVQDEWSPYHHVDAGSRHVRFADFAADGKFVTCNEPGMVAVWDFATRKLAFHFRISRTSIPALSPDRKYVGYAGGNKVAFINLETQEPVGMKAAPGMDFWVRGQFSPSGKKFAASSQRKLMIWDLETGEVLFEGEIPGVSLAYGLRFPAEDFVLVSKEYLVEWTSGIKVWQYTGSGRSVCAGNTMFMLADAVVPVEMPHPEAVRLLEEAKLQSDLFVVKKGVSLAIDVSQLPVEYQAEIKESLAKQIAKIGCQVADNADVTVKATITGPKKETVSYFRAGSFEIHRYSSTINFVYDGKNIWGSTQSNVPGALTTPRDKSYQQQIDEAGAKPNLRFFGYANLPEYLQKPAENTANQASARPQQTLGVSKISSNGLN